jgi:hypothetical protein
VRGVKVGVATSVRKADWEAARIFPPQQASLLQLSKPQLAWLALFSPTPATMATSTVERIADSDDEASTTPVDDLIQRGRSQGHLSLAELRTAFDQAGITPAEGRSILRELSEPGVRLGNELAKTPKGRSGRSASAAARAGQDSDEADPGCR